MHSPIITRQFKGTAVKPQSIFLKQKVIFILQQIIIVLR